MFKNNFIKLCNQTGESPSSVCRKNGITPATFSRWTESSVPRQATLMRIADYFGVTVDDLLREDEPTTTEDDVSGIKKQLFRQIDKLDIDALAELESYVNYLADKKQKNK